MFFLPGPMRTEDFNYHLPPELIAQHPAPVRDASRLLVFERATGAHTHTRFPAFVEYLKPGDLIVMNNSKVIPARLHAIKSGSGGAVEILLVEEVASNEWWVMLKPGKRVRPGTELRLLDRTAQPTGLTATVQEKSPEGHYRLTFSGGAIHEALNHIGEIPLPPYIQRPSGSTDEDATRYQTVYAGPSGSVAAPTAGLHFTADILAEAKRRGAEIAEVTLHVGLGTFAPVKVDSIEKHKMHFERYEISASTAARVNSAKAEGRRIIAIGTTSVRVLESAATSDGGINPGSGKTNIFIYPPRDFKIVDALLTNFHLPESTLLMLVSAFAAPGRLEGRETILRLYEEAVRERYRFFSYGDAMLIL